MRVKWNILLFLYDFSTKLHPGHMNSIPTILLSFEWTTRRFRLNIEEHVFCLYSEAET